MTSVVADYLALISVAGAALMVGLLIALQGWENQDAETMEGTEADKQEAK